MRVYDSIYLTAIEISIKDSVDVITEVLKDHGIVKSKAS